MHYRESDSTVACALQCGTNMSKSKIITKWSVFQCSVTYIGLAYALVVVLT